MPAARISANTLPTPDTLCVVAANLQRGHAAACATTCPCVSAATPGTGSRYPTDTQPVSATSSGAHAAHDTVCAGMAHAGPAPRARRGPSRPTRNLSDTAAESTSIGYVTSDVGESPSAPGWRVRIDCGDSRSDRAAGCRPADMKYRRRVGTTFMSGSGRRQNRKVSVAAFFLSDRTSGRITPACTDGEP